MVPTISAFRRLIWSGVSAPICRAAFRYASSSASERTRSRRRSPEQSTLKRQHSKACKLAEIPEFVPYTFRHTCLTRWAKILDPYTLAYLAGHSDFGTTKRYVHPNLNTAREALAKARSAQGGHKIGHSENGSGLAKPESLRLIA